MPNPITDARVLAGMKAQLAMRAARLAAGARHLGWKAGFGAPAALAKLALPGPLVGFMLADARVVPGDVVSVAGWTKPVAEPEIAIYMGRDLAGGEAADAVRAAIAGIGPAIELADLDPPPDDVAVILAGNIFHRRVVLGRAHTSRPGANLDGLSGIVTRAGDRSAPVTDLEANTGALIDVVAHMAATLAACGEQVRAGDIIIAGSVVPPLFLAPSDDEVAFHLEGIGGVSVRVSHA